MWGLFVALRKAAKMGGLGPSTAAFAAAVLCGGLLTQAAVADGTPPTPPKAPPVPYDTTAWAGLNWGLGIAADFDVGGTRVANASIVNGIVRLNDTSSNVGVSFVLEAHYFLKDTLLRGCANTMPIKLPTGYIDYNCTEIAWGPFVAIEVGDGTNSSPANNGPITAYALGLMVGLHHPKLDPTGKPDTTSWNLGIGLRIDPKAQVLGDGFVANQAPPVGEMAIRYKTEPKAGVMLMSSFSF
jgi:hypothetical protein